ncbi:Single-stranded DNA-binding protein why1 [Ranunculus cassubicifolius]
MNFLSSLHPPLLPSTSFHPSITTPIFFPPSLRTTPSNFTIKCRRSDYFEPQRFNNPKPPTEEPSLGAFPPRVFVGYSIYKGKAALTIEPKAPEFTSLDSGSYKVSREGIVLLQFAPAVGTRQYDWSRKQVFSLSVVEIGTLMGLGPRDSCEFFHDPNKGKSDEGKVRKVLKAEPLPDGSGHFFNLSVQNRLLNVDESIYIPVSKAEFTVMVSAFNFVLPFLLGWHAFANSITPEDSLRPNPRSGAEIEWSR